MTSDNHTNSPGKGKLHFGVSFYKFVQETDIDALVSIPPVIAISILITGAFLGSKIYPDGIPEPLNNIVIGCCSFIASLSGVAQIVRREAPGPFGKHKAFAMTGGILWLLICWVSGVVLIYSAISQ